jgi:hypothetical protein
MYMVTKNSYVYEIVFMKSYKIGNVSSQRVIIKTGSIHARCSFGIVSQRERLQSYSE